MHKIVKVTLPTVKHIIAVASGKGGVGKSTVAANISIELARAGYKTALVDADLYGPSVPILFGLEGEQVKFTEAPEKQQLIPFEKLGVKLMSIGFLVNPTQALIWRGPIASSTLLQMFTETQWGEIDFMVVDLPPGTGDIPLTLCQQVDLNGVIVVTTPQHLSFADVQKAIMMFQNKDLNIPMLGIVENMSYFTPENHPDEKYFLFGKGGGKTLADKFNTELLEEIPLVEGLSEEADKGNFSNYTKSKVISDTYSKLVRKITDKILNIN